MLGFQWSISFKRTIYFLLSNSQLNRFRLRTDSLCEHLNRNFDFKPNHIADILPVTHALFAQKSNRGNPFSCQNSFSIVIYIHENLVIISTHENKDYQNARDRLQST